MSEKRVEKRFKEALGQYDSIVDEDQLWSELEDRLPKKKKKRRGVLWFLFGIPLGLMLLAYFLPSSSDKALNAHIVNEESSVFVNDLTQYEATEMNLTSKNIKQTEVNEAKTTEELSKSSIYSASLVKNPGQDVVMNAKESTHSIVESDEEKSSEIEVALDYNVNEMHGNNPLDNFVKLPLVPFSLLKFNHVKIQYPVVENIKNKRIKPQKKKDLFIAFNYHAGIPTLRQEISPSDTKVVKFGDSYFSHGISFSMNQYVSSRFYGKVVFTADNTFMKFSESVSRDTIVPTSSGEQIIAYNEYSTGVVDTESGIPLVNATYNRQVTHLNSLASFSAGLGVGYRQPVGKWNIHLEVEALRSLYSNFSGLGRLEGGDKISTLSSFSNYFSEGPRYILNANMKTEYALAKQWMVTLGIQYRHGINSLVLNTAEKDVRLQLFRMSLGIKKSI